MVGLHNRPVSPALVKINFSRAGDRVVRKTHHYDPKSGFKIDFKIGFKSSKSKPNKKPGDARFFTGF